MCTTQAHQEMVGVFMAEHFHCENNKFSIKAKEDSMQNNALDKGKTYSQSILNKFWSIIVGDNAKYVMRNNLLRTVTIY